MVYLVPMMECVSRERVYIHMFAWLLVTVGIVVGLTRGIEGKDARNRCEEAVYIIAGAFSIMGGLVHIFFPRLGAEETGYPQNELFQLEVGIANLVIGIAQIVAGTRPETHLLAVVLVTSWGWMLAINHVWSFLAGNPHSYLLRQSARWFGPWPFYCSIIFPAILLSFYLSW